MNTQQAEKMWIPTHRLNDFEKEIGRLNRVATRNGFDLIEFLICKEEARPLKKTIEYRQDGHSTFKEIWVHHTPVYVIIPVLSLGFELIGKAEAVNGSHMFYGDGEELHTMQINNKCDHCYHNLKHTFIVRKGDEVRQVGRECLKVHTGIDATRVEWQLAVQCFFKEAGCDEYWHDGGHIEYFTTYALIQQVAYFEDRGFDWKDGFGNDLFTKDIPKEAYQFDAQDLFEEFKVHIRELRPISDFANNVKVAFGNGQHIDQKYIKIVGAGFYYWLKDRKKIKQMVGGHFGTVGERGTFTLIFKDMTIKMNHFGYGSAQGCTYIYKGVNEAGQQFTYFSSKEIVKSNQFNQSLEVTATVKDHSTHPKFGDSTIITRCKLTNQ